LSSALALAARQQKQANKEAKQQQAFKGIVVAGGRPRAWLAAHIPSLSGAAKRNVQ
jgi:hypothetical protein